MSIIVLLLIICIVTVFMMVFLKRSRKLNMPGNSSTNSQVIYEDIQNMNDHIGGAIGTERNEAYISASAVL